MWIDTSKLSVSVHRPSGVGINVASWISPKTAEYPDTPWDCHIYIYIYA